MTPSARSFGLTALAALSGGATLAGEVLGSRLLRPVLGSTAMAQSGTVAGVLGALGAGAWWTGRALARGRYSPRQVLVVGQLALAVWCLVAAPAGVALATPAARVLVGVGDAHPVLAGALRLALGLALTASPGLLAGSMYPAAVALLGRGAGRGTAWAGAASSLGAAVTALGATFVLAPAVGIQGTLQAVAGMYLAAALLGWRIEGVSETAALRPLRGAAAETETETETETGVAPVLAAVALVGMASTTWQAVMTRLGELSFGPSAYALAAALAAHVTSLAVGELAVIARVERSPAPRRTLGVIAAAGAAGAVLVLPLALRLPALSEARLVHGAPDRVVLWGTAYALVGAMTLPVVGCVGAAMAFGARAMARGVGTGADANGRMLLAMGAGNVAGAVAAPLLLLPWLRLEGAMAAVGAMLAAAAWVSWVSPGVSWGGMRGRARVLALAGTAVLGVLAVRAVKRAEPGAVLTGPYLYAGGDLDLGRVAWRRDGREATVAVRRDQTGGVLLQINGKVDATSVGDATTQTVVGVVPPLMVRAPRDVLVVGLGSGMTVDAARAVPGVERVVVAEVVPEVVRAAREDFAVTNHHVLADPRVRVVAEDAAHYLRGTSRTFDAIVSEPSNPWVAGMSDLFTREAFEAGRARLRPGGAMGAWFHAYSTDAAAVESIVATFVSVFPKCALVEIAPGQDYLLVGFREPYTLDVGLFLARADTPAVRAILAPAGLDTRAALVARFLAGAGGVAAVGRGGEVLRAADLTLEFRAPALLYRDAMADVFGLFSRVQDLPFAGLGASGPDYLRVLDESEPLRESGVHVRNMALADKAGALSRAISEGETALGIDPNDMVLRTVVSRMYLRRAARRRRIEHDPGGAEADLTSVVELRPQVSERFRALVALGDLAANRRDGQRAYGWYVEALDIAHAAREPAPELHLRMAEALAILGARDEASRELDTAIRQTMDPGRRTELERLRH